MPRQRTRTLPRWLSACFRRQDPVPAEVRRAMEIVAAVDAGGTPLNPARINAAARDLGLEVSRRAEVEDTVRRIREAVDRIKSQT